MAACGSIPMSYSVSNLTAEKSSWQHLWEYCLDLEFEPFAAKDAIEQRIGVNLECDCQIINNEVENRRKSLANAFGADLGEPGRDYEFFYR